MYSILQSVRESFPSRQSPSRLELVCEESLSGVALLEPVGVVGRSASGKIELRGVKYEKEEAAEVGSSDGTGATETLGFFRSLIVEQRVTVSSWRTLTLSSNFEIPLFLLLRLDSRDIMVSLRFLLLASKMLTLVL